MAEPDHENARGGSEWSDLVRAVREFRDEREWRRFHNPKDLAVSIVLEAGEVLEHFQWKDADEVARLASDPDSRAEIAAELADVLLLLISTADVLDVDLVEAASLKLAVNAEKYPVDKCKGSATKYDRL